MPKHRTWIELDERAVRHNVNQLRLLIGQGTQLCAVIKANAYGHGLRDMAILLEGAGVEAFAVDSIDEALLLREILPQAFILTLGYVMLDRLQDAVHAGIRTTVYDEETVHRLQTAAELFKCQAFIHLKVDTGLSRLGVLAANVPELLSTISSARDLVLEGLATHFANVDDPGDQGYTSTQCQRFENIISLVRAAGFDPPFIHCAKSSAVLLYPDTHATMVRPGITLYGIWPSPEIEFATRQAGVKCDFLPVLTWKTRVAQVKSLPAGTPVGYFLTETLRRKSRVAVLPIGYYDGYDRKLSSVGEVLIGGSRCRVLGRICMNMIMVDASEVPQIELEQEVILLGRTGRHRISADHLAKLVGTTSYEIVTRLNPLIPRVRTTSYD